MAFQNFARLNLTRNNRLMLLVSQHDGCLVLAVKIMGMLHHADALPYAFHLTPPVPVSRDTYTEGMHPIISANCSVRLIHKARHFLAKKIGSVQKGIGIDAVEAFADFEMHEGIGAAAQFCNALTARDAVAFCH